jgi:RHS repeat-associated protein
LHSDERGSIVAVSDSSGAVISTNSYDEYGIPGSANIGRFQYTGQIWLPELGVYYYKARMYSPTAGRFLQTDPIGYADSPNLYQYTLNNPINATDPLGLLVMCTGSILYYDSCGGGGNFVGNLSCAGECSNFLSGEDRAALGITDPWPDRPKKTGNAWPLSPLSPGLVACAQNAAACVVNASATSHDYKVGPFYICPVTLACTQAIQQTFPSYVVPNLGQSVSSQQISPVYLTSDTWFIVGHVQTFFYNNGFSARNITQSDHWLCCGQVDISNHIFGGSWYVSAHGYGSNYFGVGWANQAYGPVVFQGMLGSYISVVRALAGTYENY